MDLLHSYQRVRKRSEKICAPLQTEDYVVQPVVDVSPPKWHLGHTTWFFETFILKPTLKSYKEFNTDYNFVFNSYYESVGARVVRTDRGNLSRPGVADVFRYREYVDKVMAELLSNDIDRDLEGLLVLGLNHEEQHQELLYADIKYILGHNPLLPAYSADVELHEIPIDRGYISIDQGVYEIGHTGNGFCFDNELGRHKVYLQDFSIHSVPVSNREYLEFIYSGGYTDFRHWHADGWEWVNANKINAPLYWHNIEGKWMNYTLAGIKSLNDKDPVCHISYYEAAAYAAWKGARLPTEFEWEAASKLFSSGRRWEWTESAYLPYPGFTKAAGAIGEYNGKFMVNQMVLRGSSDITSPGHSRNTYRNFFQPHLRWQYTGLRLANS